MIAVNVTSVATLARLVGRQIADRRSGGVIFTSSVGSRPLLFFTLYGATTVFVTTLAVSMKYEMKDMGVDVLSFEPGMVRTEMSERIQDEADMSQVGFTMMGAEEAMETCIQALGKDDVCTPGWMNQIKKFFASNLPWALAMPTMFSKMRAVLPPEKTSL